MFAEHAIAFLDGDTAIPFILFLGFVVWSLSTAAGGGGPVLFLPAVSFVAPLKEIAPITSVTAGLVSIHRVFLFRHHIQWPILKWLLPGSILGSTVGVHIFTAIHAQWLVPLLAVFLIFNALYSLRPPKSLSFRVRSWHFLVAGFLFGGISAIVGAASQGINVLFLNRGVLKERLIATKAVDAVVVQTVKIIGYLHIAAVGHHVLMLGMVAAAGAMLGNYAGKYLLERMSDRIFTYAVSIMLSLFGMLMLFGFFPFMPL